MCAPTGIAAMSLDAATVSLSGSFAEGQAYVALSRVTGANALALARPVRGVDIKTPKMATAFYELLDIQTFDLFEKTDG